MDKKFIIGEFYHIRSAGIGGGKLFLNDDHCERFLVLMSLLNSKDESFLDIYRSEGTEDVDSVIAEFWKLNTKRPVVDIVAYYLGHDHYHLILRQLEEDGIGKFMQSLNLAYTVFFNKTNDRSGPLFEGKFRYIQIDSMVMLLYLSVYVNKNNLIHETDPENWKYSSLENYKSWPSKDDLCNPSAILDQFKDLDEYVEFIDNNAFYFEGKEGKKKYLLEG